MLAKKKFTIVIVAIMLLQLVFPIWSGNQVVDAAVSGPIAVSFSPANNTSNVQNKPTLQVSFDENIKKGDSSKNIVIYKYEDNRPAATFQMNNSNVTVSGNILSINTSYSNLALDTDFYVLIDAGAVVNESNGAQYSGIQAASTWSFKTIASNDNTPITISSDNANVCPTSQTCTGTVPINSSISFTFNKEVYVSGSTINIVGGSRTISIPVTSSEVTGSGTRTITIKPNDVLQPSTVYTLSINNQNIIDASSNRYGGSTWKFTTGASPVQLITQSPAPASSAVLVNSSLSLTFDQNVQGNAGKKVQIRRVSDNMLVFDEYATSSRVSIAGNIVTLNRPSNFEGNTSYYVTVEAGAFYQTGNPDAIFYGIHNAADWRFTTGHVANNIKPVITTYTPARNSQSISQKALITLNFSEKVFANSGTIEIREFNSNALYRSIPLTSIRLTGSGTEIITIDPHRAISGEAAKSFNLNTRYYVTISEQAFSNQAGNMFDGLKTSSNYNFLVGNTEVLPQLVTLSPANLSTTVATNTTFKATFDKAVVVENDSAVTFTPLTNTSTATIVRGTMIVDPKDAKSVLIVQPGLLDNTEYYVNIDENSIRDANYSYFIGILNQQQWRIKTLGGDKNPPSITKTEVSGDTIRIVYNKLLNEQLKPSPASFYATVAGSARNINSVSIEGNVVFITLSSAVTSSQKVFLSYTKPGQGLIQDISGNQAPSFSNITVSNGFTSTNPTVTSSSYSGKTITVNFSENLAAVHKLAYTQFDVRANSVSYTIDKMVHSGSRLTITLNQTIPANNTIDLIYSLGLYPLQGASSNEVQSFTHRVGTTTGNGGSTNPDGPPVITRITSSGNTLVLQYDEPLKASSIPGAFQYSVVVDGKVRSITGVRMQNDAVVLTLSGSLTGKEEIKVSYAATNYTVLDADSNPAASFTNMYANRSNDTSTSTPITLQGAILRGDVLTLNFSGNLDSGLVPASTSFVIRVNNNTRMISSVSVSGSQVIIKLTASAKIGESVIISYYNTTSQLKSAGGYVVDGFLNFNVANQTTVLDMLPDDFAFADNGVLLKESTSTRSNDVSPGGRSVNRYTIKTESLTQAVSSLADAGIKDSKIVFEVPASESAAIVAYPIVALQVAKSKGNVVLVIKHNDMTYEIPLSALDLTAAAKQVSGNSIANHLRVAIEKGNTSATSKLTSEISSRGVTLIEGPFYYDMSIVNGSRSEQLTTYTDNIVRTVFSNKSMTASRMTAVHYDEIAGTISAAPTTFNNANGGTNISFKRPGNSAYAIVSSEQTFTDTTSHWANSAILIMARKFVVEGHSSTKFSPQVSITRGEFATYIAKGLGLSANKEAARKFTDVNNNSAMGGYIGAAAASGIVAGVTSTKFDPNSSITRQDMAIMMIRAANYAGISTSLDQSADRFLQGYKDQASVSSYAKTAMAQAIQTGIISGTTTTTLSPKQNATRAEGTIMIMRLLEKADYLQK